MTTQFDKLTMAHSLEGRVPYLDHELMDFASRLPDQVKLKGGVCKWILREAGKSVLPKEDATREKAAFYLPFETYLRDPSVKTMLQDALDPIRIKKRGLFDPGQITAMMEAPEQDGFLNPKRAFSIAALEWWFEAFAPGASFGS
jgi:asparagine synthase (glutamine-hydrolysing)